MISLSCTLCLHCPFSFVENPADMSHWPVTATRTNILYKNIYCALCHGVLDVNDTQLPDFSSYEYSFVNATFLVEFWWMTITCDAETIEEFVEKSDNFTFSSIKPLLNSRYFWLAINQALLMSGNYPSFLYKIQIHIPLQSHYTLNHAHP